MSASSSRVPTLSFADAASDAFVARVGEAYEQWGFCGFVDHGVDDELIAGAYRVFKAFFDLPPAVKRSYHVKDGGGARGYTMAGVERAKDADHPDLKEFWHVGRELPPGHRHADLMPPNLWPSEIPEFREYAYGLFQALDSLGRRVLRVLARRLEIGEDFFDASTREGNSILRPIHYPPVPAQPGGSVRAAAHEDINLITLLIGAEGPGLEVKSRSGDWIPVTTVPGAIVVNIGDMLQRLTNHVFPSTTHRVINPQGAQGRSSRYSIPFFLHPNADFVIQTLSGCVSVDNPDRYPEPLASHDYLQQRLVEIGLLKN